jgi:phage FluMu protein gp41
MVHTEHEFTLPIGYLDADGTLHRDGVMRLATAADEILPLKDPRVVRNPAYLIVILLSRVVTRLGTVSPITPKVIEEMYAKDLAALQDLYNDINRLEDQRDEAVCPQCQHKFQTEAAAAAGGSSATPWISSTGR